MKAPAPEAFSWERAFKQVASHLEGAGILGAGFRRWFLFWKTRRCDLLVTDQEGFAGSQ